MALPFQKNPVRDGLPLLFWGVFGAGLLVGCLLIVLKPSPQTTLPVPARDFPAYHILTPNDLTTKTVEASAATTETVRDSQSLVGHYTRNALSAGAPVRASDVVTITDPSLITHTLAAAIPTNSATILGGKLRAGDVVRLAAVPISTTTIAPGVIFTKVLVLDVKIEANDTLVVLAIPADRWMDYLDKTRNATVMLARPVD